MIVVRLRGGLGNQLFQYAAGWSLAAHHQTTLKLDLYTYSRHKYRKFELENFNVDPHIASRAEVHKYTGKNKVIRFLNKRENYLRCPQIFAQPHYHFYNDFFHLPSELYLSGYWQSEKYFISIADQIRAAYTPRLSPDSKNKELIDHIQNVNSVSIHIRRGDYVNPRYTGFFGSVSERYYQQAIEHFQKKINNPVFFIFSDDIEWCSRNMKVESAVFINHNSGAASFMDLSLMSNSKHNIIANSTFSWWGAWLNQNPNKTVIAPSPWFKQDYLVAKEVSYPCRYYNTKDLIPENWITLAC